MNICLICDNEFDIKQFSRLSSSKNNSITLFSLTSNFILLEKIKKELQHYGHVIEINSAELINAEVKPFREELLEWSHQMGELQVGRKNIKQWVMTPDKGVSTWWFGQLSETNNLQTDLFFKMVQIKAIKKFLATVTNECFVLAVGDSVLQKAIAVMIKKNKQKIKILRTKVMQGKGFKAFAKTIFTKLGFCSDLLAGAMRSIHFFKQWVSARRILGSLNIRVPKENSLLFVSYFPAIDKIAAEHGVFRNKYALPLQEMLKQSKIPITWLMMPVPYDGYNYSGALRLAKTFNQQDEKIFILQEFFSPGVLLKALWWWLRQTVVSVILYPVFKKQVLADDFLGKEHLSVMKALWRLSFTGSAGQQGIVFYLAFKKVFSIFSVVDKCLYYAEMQNWEKALNAAKHKIQSNVVTMGFQHAALAKNYFSYFYSKKDIKVTNKQSSENMPLPDLVIANGALTYDIFSANGFSNIVEAESIRYLYLNEMLSATPQCADSFRLLVCGTMTVRETKSLISMLYLVTQRLQGIEVWVKGHPSMPVELFCEELGICLSDLPWKIMRDDIRLLLPQVQVVLIPDGSVSFEALAFGCHVIVPIFSDAMSLNPLNDFDGHSTVVSSVNEFISVLKLLREKPASHIQRNQEFIKKYWDLDSSLSKWQKLLGFGV